MTFILESAARVSSGVAHVSSTFAQVGTIAGGALAAIFVVGTGGLGGVALLVAAGGAALTVGGAAGFVGGLIDDLEGASITERIQTGAPDVFLDEAKLEAASASPDCITDGHGEPVETGSDSIFIHGYPASRLTDKVECGGIIKEGSPHIFYGGDLQHDPNQTPSKDEPIWLRVFNLTASVVGFWKNPKGAWEWVTYGANAFGFADQVGLVSDDVNSATAPVTTGIALVDTMLLTGSSALKGLSSVFK